MAAQVRLFYSLLLLFFNQKLMVELTDQEKLERRRQKRQQRILQAGESRLSKITGTAYRKHPHLHNVHRKYR